MLVSDCRLDADTANLACSCCECGLVDKSMKRNNVPDERKSDCIGKLHGAITTKAFYNLFW